MKLGYWGSVVPISHGLTKAQVGLLEATRDAVSDSDAMEALLVSLLSDERLTQIALPYLLETWARDLFVADSSFLQSFHRFLGLRRSDGRKAFDVWLHGGKRDSVVAFMRDGLMAVLARETQLPQTRRSTLWDAFSNLASFGVVLRDVGSLFSEWWALRDRGHAVSVLVFNSCLAFPDDENPLIKPPRPNLSFLALLSSYQSLGDEESWSIENIEALLDWATPRRIIDLTEAVPRDPRFREGTILEYSDALRAQVIEHPTYVDARVEELADRLSREGGFSL